MYYCMISARGIKIGDLKAHVLLFEDDDVFLGENWTDFQQMSLLIVRCNKEYGTEN